MRNSFKLWAVLLLGLLFHFQTFAEDAPAAGGDGAPSGERISQEGMVDMEDGALSGVLERLHLDPDAFGVTNRPGTKDAKGDGEGATAKTAEAAKKKEEEEAAGRAPAGAGAGDEGKEKTLDLGALNLNAEQVAAVEQAITDGVDLTGFTAEELEEFGFTGEQVLKFEELVADASAAATGAGETDLDKLGLTPEQKAAVQALLPKEVITAEDFAKVQTDLTAAQAENNRLAKELKHQTPGVAVAQLHPVFMVNDETKLAERERAIATFEQWALKHWDGAEAKETAGDQPAQRAYTAEEVRERYGELQNERTVLIPQARQVLATVRQQDQLALTAYPALKDSKSEESVLVATILAQAPGLTALFPNVRMILMDALAGEKARVKAAAGNGAGAKPAKGLKLVVGKPAAKVAPKLPMGAKPARAGAGGVSRSVRSDTVDEKKFVEMGSSRDALVHLIGQTNLVGRS